MTRRIATVCALTVAVLAGASWAQAQVYKCPQQGGRVLYSDVPCKGGAVIDVTAGAANPAAVRQLAEDNAAFDRRMAALRAIEEDESIRRQSIAEAAQSTAEASGSSAQYYDVPYGWGYGGYGYVSPVPRPKARPHARGVVSHAHEHRVPASPSPLTSDSHEKRR